MHFFLLQIFFVVVLIECYLKLNLYLSHIQVSLLHIVLSQQLTLVQHYRQ
uniref:Uncharacterized protein n=1 Tax=uncultured marine virus TaxID=186617 RepID=A0A0F7L765_9VIRU|nr:hypothetical protein [uncultured marine virus]